MKKKLFTFFAGISVLGAITLASCGGQEATSTTKPSTGSSTSATSKPTEDQTSELFYSNIDSSYIFSRFGSSFTMSINGTTYSGKCSVANGVYTLTASGLENCTAQLVGNVLVVTLNGTSYNFYKNVQYSVTLHINDETELVSVTNGHQLSKPEDPKLNGYVFVGWYKDSLYTEIFDFDNEIVTENLDLYARFVESDGDTVEYTVTFAGCDLSPVSTLGGVVYDLPTLADKDGKKFVGWWISDTNKADMLSRQYDEDKLTADTTLFPVYDDGEIHISVNEGKISWNSMGTAKQYDVIVKNPKGEEISTKVNVTSYVYNFSKLEAGLYEVTVKCGDKSTTAYYAHNTLSRVSKYEIKDSSILMFAEVENAEGYKITVECGNENHNHTEYDLGNSTFYDFSNCPMKEGGIKFTVTAYADGFASSYPTTYVFDRTLDKVTNVLEKNGFVTWTKVPGATSYIVVVTTGDVSNTYKLGDVNSLSVKEYTGEITVSVTPVSNGYNSPEATLYTFTKTALAAPTNVQINNTTVTWDEVANATGYVVKINDQEYTTTTNSYTIDISSLSSTESYKVSVKAVASDAANNSYFSEEVPFNYLQLSSLAYSNGLFSWNSVVGASKYGVVVNDQEEVFVTTSEAEVLFTKAGVNTLTVKLYDANGEYVSEKSLEVTAYELAFNTCTGDSSDVIESLYLAKGDELVLPTHSYLGYVFAGWYNLPNGPEYNGKLYVDGDSMPESNLTLYAYWTSVKYTVTLNCGDGAEIDETEAHLSLNSYFVLPVPTRTANDALTFDGWYTDVNGKGVKITSASGVSLNAWAYKSNITLYASWVRSIAYEEILNNNNEVVAYRAVKGSDLVNCTEVTVPAYYNGLPVTELGSFSGCMNLVKLNIPDTLTFIDTITSFAGCSSLEAINVYEVEERHEVFYTSYDGVLYYNNSVSETAGWEVKFVPSNKSGRCELMPGTVNIPQKVFADTKVSSVFIPKSVSTIGTEAFFYSKTLKEVNFENTPENEEAVELSINSRAFIGCYGLETITLPARTVYIAAGVDEAGDVITAFTRCYALDEILVEEGNENYASINGMLYDASKTTLLLVGAGTAGELNIKLGASEIAPYAAMECKYITSVLIPGSITKIGENAFASCTNLATVEFEDEETTLSLTICEKAFYQCDITELTLPGYAREIEAQAFGGNKRLTQVTVNANGTLNYEDGITADSSNNSFVEKVIIGDKASEFNVAGAFGGSNNLLSSVVATNNQYYSTINGVLYNKDATKILFYPALANTSFTVPETVVEITSGTFRNRADLVSIEIPASVEVIGDEAFAGCTKLNAITFTGERTNSELTVGNSAFKGCSSLTELVLPNGTTSIGDNAFEATGIKTFTVPEGVVYLGDYAFKSSKLTKISLPESLTTLGSFDGSGKLTVFDSCTSLNAITVAENNTSLAAIDSILYLKEDGVVRTLCYYPQYKYGAVTIPSTVNNIAEGVFSKSYVTKVSFIDGKSALNTDGTEGDLTVGKSAFEGCTYLTTVSLPNLVTVPSRLFYGCKALTSFEVDNKVTTIEGAAFYQAGQTKGTLALTFEEGNDSNPLTIVDSSAYSNQFFYAGITSLVLPKRLEYIGKSAFYYCTKLTSITIPEGCKTIANDAFNYCSSLATVTFADNSKLETVGSGAFTRTKIKAISLPDSVISLGDSAFAYCTQLTSFTLPKQVTYVPKSLLNGCSKLETFSFGEAVVTEIKDTAFSGCTKLTSFGLPSSVTAIGKEAFKNAGITTFTFAEKSHLSSIAEGAFTGAKFTEFAFPTVYDADDKVTTFASLGSKLFNNSSSLTKITLSQSVNSIVDVFTGCTKLSEVVIAEDNKYFAIDDAAPVIYSADYKTLYAVFGNALSGEYTVNSNTVTISDGAFSKQSGLTSITIPASVTTIGNRAFDSCELLEEVNFAEGSTLSTFGEYAFNACESLLSIKLPSSVTTLGENMFFECYGLASFEGTGVTYVADGAFAYCMALESVKFNTGLEYIGSDAFNYCQALTSIDIYANTVVGMAAFKECSSLETVNIAEGVEAFEMYTFYGCTSLTSVTLPSSLTYIGDMCFSGTGLTSIVIPNKVATIGGQAFSGDYSLKEVTIKGTNYIDMSAFEGCSGLETLNLENVNEISDRAFYGCSKLSEVTFPDSLTAIGACAFASTGLTKVTLPKNLAVLGTETSESAGGYWSVSVGVFMNCTELTEVVIESNILDTIEGETFQGCTSLTSIELPGNIKKLGHRAFKNSGLVEANISGITELGVDVFAGNTKLTTVYLNSTLTELPKNMFNGCSSLASIDLPVAVVKLGDYSLAGTAIESVSLDNIETFGTNVFDSCTNLSTFVVNSPNLTAIPAGMFNGCSNLTTVELSDALTSIGNNAFAGTAISSFKIPASLEGLSDGVFKGCTSLTTVDFSACNSFKKLGASVFEDCSKLTAVSLPDTLQSIGNFAFKNSGLSGDFVIGKNVASLGYNPFIGCKGIILSVADGNENIKADETNSLFDSQGLLLVASPSLSGTLTIQSSAAPYAFEGCDGITKLVFVEGIEEIGSNIFCGLPNLEEVVLPSTLTTIADNAFNDNTKLSTINIPLSVTSIGNNAFKNCALTSVSVSSLANIGKYAFAGNTALASLTFVDPEEEVEGSQVVIGDYAFNGCSSLSSVTLSKYLYELGAYAFANCGLTSVTIPSTISRFGYDGNQFANNTSLTTVTVESGIRLAQKMFANCSSLTTLNLPETIGLDDSSEWNSFLGIRTFSGCTSLTSVTLPTDLGVFTDAFTGTGITSLVLPESVTIIGSNAFSGLNNLTSLEIKGELDSIGDEAFVGLTIESIFIKLSGNFTSWSYGWDMFSGWTASQTIYLNLTEEEFSLIDENGDFFSGCKANIVYGYTGETGTGDSSTEDNGSGEENPDAGISPFAL